MILSAFLIAMNLASASELAASTSAKATSSAAFSSGVAELGGCVPKEDPTEHTEEAAARKEAIKADLPKEEALARIIFSESLSTGYWNGLCQGTEASIMENIGWGVLKRVDGKKKSQLDPFTETIFAKMQFRTSFSSKKKNPFAEAFLCPLKADSYLSQTTLKPKAAAAKLYKQAQEISRRLIAQYQASGVPAENKSITNFFYPKSEFFGDSRPKWAPNGDPTKNKGYMNLLKVSKDPCVEFYHL